MNQMDYKKFNSLFPLVEKCKSVKEEDEDESEKADKKIKIKKSDVVEINPVIGSENN